MVLSEKMKFIIYPVFLALVTIVPAHAEEGVWKKYINERFGFSLVYPATLVASPDPIDGSGCEYHTSGKDFSLVAAAHFLRILDANDSLDTHWRGELKYFKGLITYKRKGASWYVVSGVTTNGYIFYHKFFTKGQNWAAFQITYPESQKAKYDPWVGQIEKHFVPFLTGDHYDRAEWKGALVK